MRELLVFIIIVLLSVNAYLFFTKDQFINDCDLMFDKGVKKAFHAGWLTGANQMRDFGNFKVNEDTLMIMLEKDTLDFNNLMDSE